MDIVKIINWLTSVEYLAGNVYLEASNQFASSQKISAFLSRLHNEEEMHAFLLGKALHAIEDIESLPKFGIRIDSATKEHIEEPFKDLYYLLKKGTLSKKELVDYIIKAEFFEWNSIFLYTMKLVKDCTSKFQFATATIESHRERIQRFLEDLPEEIMPPETLSEITKIWDGKILIVDEDESLRGFLSDLLKNMGQVEEVFNGQEGLKKIKDNFYNVILSEIRMDKMSGIDFYKKAIELNPLINRNFLFYSYEVSTESMNFIQDNHLTFFEKPISIKKVMQLTQETIDKTL